MNRHSLPSKLKYQIHAIFENGTRAAYLAAQVIYLVRRICRLGKQRETSALMSGLLNQD